MGTESRELFLGTSRIQVAGVNSGLEDVYRVEYSGDGPTVHRLGLEQQGWVVPVIVDKDDDDIFYAGTSRGGFFRSIDGGKTWHESNSGLVYKELWSLAQHPATGELYAGTQPAAIFHSKDGGESWSEFEYLRGMVDRRDWTFPGPPFIAHIKHIELCPTDPAFVIAAVEEGWLLRSINGGETWTNIKLGTALDAHSARFMPDDPNVVLHTAGTGVYRSTDGGETFTDANTGLEQRYMIPVAVHEQRPRVLFTAASEVPPPFWRRPEGANAAFYRSDDQGCTWIPLKGNLPEHISAAPRWATVDPLNPETVYFGMSDGSLWVTPDSGSSFRHVVLGGLPAITGITVRLGK